MRKPVAIPRYQIVTETRMEDWIDSRRSRIIQVILCGCGLLLVLGLIGRAFA